MDQRLRPCARRKQSLARQPAHLYQVAAYQHPPKKNDVARALSIVYTAFALFSAGWGWYMYEKRARLIRQRSGKDLDNLFGPVVVCIGLAVALVLNFAFKVCALIDKPLLSSS